MKRIIFALTMAASAAFAGPLMLLPNDGIIAGSAGATVGWGFQLTSDPVEWTSIVGVVLLEEDNPALGVFTDFISSQGGPSFGALAPGAADWVEAFDPGTFAGFGSYTIDPAALVGDHNSGTFLVLYETFTDNPATCGSCFSTSGTFVAPFTVDVVAPEPGSGTVLALGLALVGAAWRRRRRF